jgi:mRNA interferase MazF
MKYHQRDIVIANFPFSDGSGSKERPVLIISNDNVNEIFNAYLCLKITSKVKNIPIISLKTEEKCFDNPLPKESEFRLMEIVYLSESQIKEKKGSVKLKCFKKILKKIKADIL